MATAVFCIDAAGCGWYMKYNLHWRSTLRLQYYQYFVIALQAVIVYCTAVVICGWHISSDVMVCGRWRCCSSGGGNFLWSNWWPTDSFKQYYKTDPNSNNVDLRSVSRHSLEESIDLHFVPRRHTLLPFRTRWCSEKLELKSPSNTVMKHQLHWWALFCGTIWRNQKPPILVTGPKVPNAGVIEYGAGNDTHEH